MLKSLSKFEPQAYALVRILTGFMFTFHGAQKLFGIDGAKTHPLGSLLWVAGVIELVCGLGVMLGWNTRILAFLASGEMAVAYFRFHWLFRGGWNFFPTVNHGELAVLYCITFFLIACKGSGGILAVGKD